MDPKDTKAAGQGDTTTAATTKTADETAAAAKAGETTAAGDTTKTTDADSTKTTETKTAETRVVPESYALIAPEGSTFDAADLAAFGTEAKALGLTNDEAQALTDVRATQAAALSQQYRDEITADKEFGGANLPMTQLHARAGRDFLFPPGTPDHDLVTAFFDKSPMGNHPAFIRAMARLGKSQAEDRPNTGGGASPNTVKPIEDRMFPSSAKQSA